MDRLFCEPFPKSSWLLPRSLESRLFTVNDSSRPDLKITSKHCHDFASSIKLSVRGLHSGRSKILLQGAAKTLAIAGNLAVSPVKCLLCSGIVFGPSGVISRSAAGDLPSLEPLSLSSHRSVVGSHSARLISRARRSRSLSTCKEFVKTWRRRCSSAQWRRRSSPISARTTRGSCCAPRSARSSSRSVTSLDEHHFDVLREIYLNSSTADGSIVRVEQPSHEGQQHTRFLEKALAEIYFLGLLITSPGTTFGYIGQGLVGLRPWLMWAGRDSGGDVCSKARTIGSLLRFVWGV
ncbi:probable fucosyltransferase 7 [Selaginella moellendorffii]|uniref:probable fucosyltransferase 7 n=1 Tax=Selaginella moellendorffii TaxID=88036 RepID=UPI000D1C22C7|nr:probable fucosyltransferase 7 [Selaginella moellendorffii]|eukprot:XP_024518127.1 probable fucosyltransferase 7 [Selaginella moellendorffii]